MQQVIDLTRRVSTLENKWDWIIVLLVANLVSILASTWAAYRDRKALVKSNGNGGNR